MKSLRDALRYFLIGAPMVACYIGAGWLISQGPIWIPLGLLVIVACIVTGALEDIG